jgi:Prokaryotic RING finger family 2
MNARAWTTIGGAVILAGLVQFFGASAGLWIGLLMSLLLPPVMIGLARFFEVEPAVWAPALASLLGVTLAFEATRRDALLWACPALAMALMAGFAWRRRRDARRCELCDGRLTGGISFACPRCALLVCEARCWDFERVRCRLCVQNRVPALPLDSGWWDHNFAASARHGCCQLCQAAADDADLRNCPRCGRPQCRECWDDANGACSRCRWVLPALPEPLKQFV